MGGKRGAVETETTYLLACVQVQVGGTEPNVMLGSGCMLIAGLRCAVGEVWAALVLVLSKSAELFNARSAGFNRVISEGRLLMYSCLSPHIHHSVSQHDE